MNATEENIKVIVRLKPNNDKDKIFLTNNKITNSITVPGRDEFIFDKVEDGNSTQEDIFENCKGLFQSFIDGYNATIFAYGQTGSGKTFTMTGDSDAIGNTQNPGLIPRGLSFIFDKVNERAVSKNLEYLIKCSFVEIYNEHIYDLLDSQQQRLNLRFNISQEVYLEQCTEIVMDNPKDANKILQQGLLNRHISSTEMNRESSRSHAVFSIVLESRESDGDINNIKKSCLYLVDLAGSERQKDSKAENLRLKEACMINNSLLTLSIVIRKLVEAAKSNKETYIAYRDSKLTLLLKDALGGNSKTALVACIHNDKRFLTDTLSTIQFASSVKMIRNKAKINVDIHGDNEALKREIDNLRQELLKLQVPQIIHANEFDYDLVWKKRFITAMGLRACLSLDVTSLTNQAATTNNMVLKLEKTIDALRMDRDINDARLKSFKENLSDEDGSNADFNELLQNTLEKLKTTVDHLDEQITNDQLQIQVNYLSNELEKSKSQNLLAVSSQTLIHSLLNDYNSIVESGNVEKMLSKEEIQNQDMVTLQQELSETRYKNALLKKKINNNNVAFRDEKRKLEAKIKSMETNLKVVDEQREAAVVDRRRTLLSMKDLEKEAFSPVKGHISCRRGTQKKKEVIKKVNEDIKEENEDEEFIDGEVWAKKNDEALLNLNKISELENALRTSQTNIGSLECEIQEYRNEIKDLKTALFSKESIEHSLKEMEERYTSVNMALEQSVETIKRLEKENTSLEASKDLIIKKLLEQKFNLEDEMRIIEEEKETFKDELERNNMSTVYLNDENKRLNDEMKELKESLLSKENACSETEVLINKLKMKIKNYQSGDDLNKKEMEERMEDLLKSYDEMERNNKVLEEDREKSRTCIGSLKEDIQKMKDLSDSLQKMCTEKDTIIKELKNKISDTDSLVEELSNERSKLEETNQELEELQRTHNVMIIDHQKKVVELKRNMSENEYTATCKLEESDTKIQELLYDLECLKKQIQDSDKENRIKKTHLQMSSSEDHYTSPIQGSSSPFRDNFHTKSNTTNGKLVDELMDSNLKLSNKIKTKDAELVEINKVIQDLLDHFHVSTRGSLVDDISMIQTKIKSHVQDMEAVVIKNLNLETKLKQRNGSYGALERTLKESQVQLVKMKKEYDDLVNILPHGGHSNHRQKIEYFVKYKDLNMKQRDEKMKLEEAKMKLEEANKTLKDEKMKLDETKMKLRKEIRNQVNQQKVMTDWMIDTNQYQKFKDYKKTLQQQE